MNDKKPESHVAVVLNARNEDKHIEKTLIHLQNQDLKPYRIIVVNDGSTDKTEEVVSKFKEIEIVNRPKREENFVAKKELAYTVNAGLAKLQNDKNCEYVLLMSAEILLPKDYLSKIISRMEEDSKLVITAGVVKDEFASVPRGPGRVIKYDFWKKLGLEFPVNYGYEAYQLWKAQSMGYKIASYSDIISETPRKTGSEYNPKLYYYYGLGLKAPVRPAVPVPLPLGSAGWAHGLHPLSGVGAQHHSCRDRRFGQRQRAGVSAQGRRGLRSGPDPGRRRHQSQDRW